MPSFSFLLHPKHFPLLGPVFGEVFAEFGKGEKGRFFAVEDGFDDVRGEVCAVDICRDIEKMTLQEEDVCLVSVPSFAGRVPQIAVERMKKISGNGAKAILNCVYGNREWGMTL